MGTGAKAPFLFAWLFHRDQFILAGADAEGLGVIEGIDPVRRGRGILEVVVVAFARFQIVAELAAVHHCVTAQTLPVFAVFTLILLFVLLPVMLISAAFGTFYALLVPKFFPF